MTTQPALTPWSLIATVQSFNLPAGHYAVGRAGALLVRGRQVDGDVDVLVTEEVFSRLLADGWDSVEEPRPYVHRDGIRVRADHDLNVYRRETPELIRDAESIEGVRFVRLEDVRGATASPERSTPTGQGFNEVSAADRRWASAAHWTALLLAFLGPAVVMLFRGDSPFVRRHAVASLMFQLKMLIATTVIQAIALVGGNSAPVLVVVAIPVLLVIYIGWLVYTIKGALVAGKGRDFRYPGLLRGND